LSNRIIEGIASPPLGPRIGLHICRGTWSTKEEVFLTGDYTPLLPALIRMRMRQFVLEYATPRAEDIAVAGEALSGAIPDTNMSRELGVGVFNPRTEEAESPEKIVAKTEQALRFYRPEQMFLNTDCGFGCFANRCVNVEEVATAKLRSIVRAARLLRERHG